MIFSWQTDLSWLSNSWGLRDIEAQINPEGKARQGMSAS